MSNACDFQSDRHEEEETKVKNKTEILEEKANANL